MSSHFYSGTFKPKHPEKCINVRTGKKITYRSSWEFRFLNWCDANENIVQYGSELFSIPYIDPYGKQRNYWPDILMEVKTNSGELVKYLVEIKPKNQVELITEGKRRTKKSIARWEEESKIIALNKSKWHFAEQFCKDNGLVWKIITENDLF